MHIKNSCNKAEMWSFPTLFTFGFYKVLMTHLSFVRFES
jgi:hypothetical protein